MRPQQEAGQEGHTPARGLSRRPLFPGPASGGDAVRSPPLFLDPAESLCDDARALSPFFGIMGGVRRLGSRVLDYADEKPDNARQAWITLLGDDGSCGDFGSPAALLLARRQR